MPQAKSALDLEEKQMAMNRNDSSQEERGGPWLRFAKVLFIVLMTVTLFALARTMVRHHFFSGGQLNQHDATGP